MTKPNPELQALIEEARSHVMTPEEVEAQRQSFLRSVEPCEHGMVDFEDCAECRAEALADDNHA